MQTPLRPTTIVLAAALASLAIAVPAATAAPAALLKPTSTCYLDVINDWLDNNRVDRVYAIPCYAQAVQKLSSLPDVAGYSSAIDDIRRAQLAAIHSDRGNVGGPGDDSNNSGGPVSSGDPNDPNGPTGPEPASDDGGPLGSVFGVSDAQSIPLPLIVLGALALLLALAALATWLARRYQSRRPQPAPAVAKRR